MEKIFKSIRSRAAKIAEMMLCEHINDVRLLTIALCMSNFAQIVDTIMASKEGSYKHEAAHAALDIAWQPSLKSAKARAGYFSEGLRDLVELSKQNPDLATRLVPVFGEMLHKSKELGISQALKREVVDYVEYIFERDGFAITDTDDDGFVKVTLNEPKVKCMAMASQSTP